MSRNIGAKKEQYIDRLSNAKSELISALKETRDEAARDRKLSEANAIQQMIDEYEAADLNFPDPWPAVGKLDAISGHWEGNWGTSDERLYLKIDANGEIDGGRWKVQELEERLIGVDIQGRVHLELLPRPGRLLVLGWSGGNEELSPDAFDPELVAGSAERVASLKPVDVLRVPVSREIGRFPNKPPRINVESYGIDGDGRRGVLDLILKHRDLKWEKPPATAKLHYYVAVTPTSETRNLIFVSQDDTVVGTGRAPGKGRWFSIDLDPSKLKPNKMISLRMTIRGTDAVAVAGKASGHPAYLEFIFSGE